MVWCMVESVKGDLKGFLSLNACKCYLFKTSTTMKNDSHFKAFVCTLVESCISVKYGSRSSLAATMRHGTS